MVGDEDDKGYTCKVLRIVTGAQKVVHQSNKGNNAAAAGGGGGSDDSEGVSAEAGQTGFGQWHVCPWNP